MIECKCINASNKPKEIAQNKWLKEGETYHVIYTVVCLPQKQLGFHLSEIELTDKELPYEYFLASRFAFKEEDIQALLQLIKDCSDTDFSMDELMKQTELENA